MPLTQKLLFFFAFAIIVNSAYSQEKRDSTSKPSGGLDEIHVGASIRELPHIGVFFGGNKASIGVYGSAVGGLWSAGIGVKLYRKVTTGTTPTRFFRLATGVMVEPGDSGTDFTGAYYTYPSSLQLYYMAFTFGKDFYFGDHMGVSLEGGLMYAPPIDGSVAEDLSINILPAVGVKLFYKRKERVK